MIEPAYDAWIKVVSLDVRLDGGAGRSEDGLAQARVPAHYVRRAVIDCISGRYEIRSGLSIDDMTFYGDLNLSNLSVPFPIFFKGCHFEGLIAFNGVNGRTLGFDGCHLSKGLDLRNSSISGHLFLRNGFSTTGPLLLRDSTISGTVEVRRAKFEIAADDRIDASEGEVFAFSRAKATSLFWMDVQLLDASKVTLRDASVQALRHDMATRGLDCWPPKGNLVIDGFQYVRMDDCPLETLLKWLSLQPTPSSSAFSNAATALERQGLIEQADQVKAQLKRAEVGKYKSGLRRQLARIVLSIIDYGSSPSRALVAMLVLMISFVVTVESLYKLNLMAPAYDNMLLESCFYGPDTPCSNKVKEWRKIHIGNKVVRYLPPDYPRLSSVEYTIESFVPFIDFNQKRFWVPARQYLRVCLGVMSLIGMFLGSLFLASITGVLSPRSKS